MEKELDIDFIDGVFTPEDANLLLMELLRFKINFHDSRLFSDYAREGRDTLNSKKRLEQLNKSLAELRKYMADVNEDGRNLDIHCTIHVRQK
ncbi:MAG: hypothetical protein RLZZ165_1666 [Bacteroidota bacterium]|jgi:hypothetical protein